MTDREHRQALQAEGVPRTRCAGWRSCGRRPGAMFTSDLSVNEFLLVREAGFRPLGLVLGSIYHVGLQIGRWAGTRSWTCCRRRCTTPASSR